MFLKKGSKFKYTAFAVLTILNLTRLATAGNGTIRGGGDGDLTLESMLPKVIEVSGRQALIMKGKYYIMGEVIPYDRQILFGKIQRCGFLGLATCADTSEYYQINLRLELSRGKDLPYAYIPTNLKVTYDLHGKTYPIESKLEEGGILLRGAGWRDNITGKIQAGRNLPNGMQDTTDIEWGRLSGKNTESLTICLDGQCTSNEQNPLASRTLQILQSLEAQTDFNSIESSHNFIQYLEDLKPIYRRSFRFLRNSDQVPELSGWDKTNETFDYRLILLKHVEAYSRELSELGASAIRPDGLCDLATYANLTAKLRDWNAGSTAYFYDLQESGVAPDGGIQLQAMGIRQKLRRELNRKVVPYCEPASSAGQSQVDLVLND